MLNNFFPLQSLTALELSSLMPLLTLSFGAVFTLIFGTHKTKGHGLAFIVSLITIVLALFLTMNGMLSSDISLLGGTLNFNPFTKSVSLMILIFALIGVTITYGQDKKEGILSEIYALIIFSGAGMILMLSTTHLLFMFIAL